MSTDDAKPPFEPISPTADLSSIAAALISIESWARRKGYAQVAGKIDEAIDLIDDMLNPNANL